MDLFGTHIHDGSEPPNPEDMLEKVVGKPLNNFKWRECEPPQWLVEGLIQRGSVTMVSGKGGLAKSLLTLDLFIRLASGEDYPDRPWLGAFGFASPKVRVVLIEKENGERRFHRRCQEMVLGGSFPPHVVDEAFKRLIVFSADRIAEPENVISVLELICEEHKPHLIVLDPLRSFLPTTINDENDNVSIGRVVDRLVYVAKSQNVALLCVDHDSKAGEYLRGASSKRDAAEFILHLTCPDEDDPDLLKLEMKKQRDPGGQHQTHLRRVRSAPLDDYPGLFPIRFEATDYQGKVHFSKREKAIVRELMKERFPVRWADLRKRLCEHTKEDESEKRVTWDRALSHLRSVQVVVNTGDYDNRSPIITLGDAATEVF